MTVNIFYTMFESFIFLGAWYLTSIGVLISNKWILSFSNFKYPFTLTLIHMTLCFLVSKLIFAQNFIKVKKIDISFQTWYKKILPLSTIFILNIALSNISLQYIPASFMQTMRGTVPLFTFIFEIFTEKRIFKFQTFLLLLPIVFGVILATWTEINFNWIGFLCAVFSSIAISIQNILASLYFKEQLKLDPINMIYHTSFVSLILLLPFSYYTESDFLNLKIDNTEFVFVLFINIFVVLLLNFSVFNAFLKMNTLSFSVAVNLKTTITIVVSIIIFQNKVTILNAIGIAMTLFGCYLYKNVVFEKIKIH